MATTATVASQDHNRDQFAGLFSDMFKVKVTLDAESLTTLATDGGTDITVSGVALGDACIFKSLSIDNQSVDIRADVTAANTVTITLVNGNAGTIDLASATLRLVFVRPTF